MIRLENVTKYYPTRKGRKYIFRDLNLDLPEKVNLGVLGLNGAGKSTLLRLIGGVDYPNYGKITIDGSISWPLGLSGGVQQSLSGRDNAKFICRVYGDDPQTIDEKLKYIIDFAELGEYFELPVRTYSSGMRSRLLFAISMSFDFDTYLIDEITAVGDLRFRKKSQEALREKSTRSHYVMVSHNANDLIKECDNLLVLINCKAYLFRNTEEGLKYYRKQIRISNLQ